MLNLTLNQVNEIPVSMLYFALVELELNYDDVKDSGIDISEEKEKLSKKFSDAVDEAKSTLSENSLIKNDDLDSVKDFFKNGDVLDTLLSNGAASIVCTETSLVYKAEDGKLYFMNGHGNPELSESMIIHMEPIPEHVRRSQITFKEFPKDKEKCIEFAKEIFGSEYTYDSLMCKGFITDFDEETFKLISEFSEKYNK